MLHFPLLSDAYAAALFPVGTPRPEPEPLDGAPDRWPLPADPSPAPDASDPDRDDGDDIETARTRPLRLDQIHL